MENKLQSVAFKTTNCVHCLSDEIKFHAGHVLAVDQLKGNHHNVCIISGVCAKCAHIPSDRTEGNEGYRGNWSKEMGIDIHNNWSIENEDLDRSFRNN